MDKFPRRETVEKFKTEIFQVDPKLAELPLREWIYIGWDKEQALYDVCVMLGPAPPSMEAQMLTYYMFGKWHDTDNYPQEQEELKEVEAV